MEKKTLGILLTTGPYTFQNSHTFYDLCKATLAKGYGVKVFLFMDGVNNAKLNQDPDPANAGETVDIRIGIDTFFTHFI